MIALGILIIQGCSNKEFLPVDRPFEVVKTKGCEVNNITLCTINKDDTYTNIIDNMDLCIQELIAIINSCKKDNEWKN